MQRHFDKKMFTNVWNLFHNIPSPWSTVATPCNASCGGGIEVKVRSCTNPRPQVGMMMGRFLNFNQILGNSSCQPKNDDFLIK